MGQKNTKLKPKVFKDLCQNTEFSEEEIKEWYKLFMIECPDGFITRDQFKAIYAAVFPDGDSSLFSESVFRSFDANHDGTIDFREFIVALSVATRGSAEDKLKWMFNMYDLDGNGYISRHEMIKIVSAMHKMIGPSLGMPDDESTPEKRANKIFFGMDSNLDGRISLQEFIYGAQNDPYLFSLLQTIPSPRATPKPPEG
ncbi:unnamed protein product [Allacma fusca]|uniref:EF-hand domain-containing protein n=1 Tax=Allacma fusca TaxID=39272 RepID=A0A8J2LM12_9HEXA|nr:unnamed protein product [Allacma fusca]